ncbi:MFS transporter [Chloroflexota bacterium]
MSLPLKSNSKIFYGWIIVAVLLVIICIPYGIRFSFGVFFKSLEADLGLSRAATSSIFSVYMLSFSAFAIAAGWASDKYGPRPVFSLMSVLGGLSLLITSQTSSLWQILLSYSLLFGMGTGGMMPIALSVVSRWFEQKRGFVLGIATSAAGLGSIIVAPFAAYLISNIGWRMSYIVLGLITMLVTISLAPLLRRDPREIGMLPYGAESAVGVVEMASLSKGTKPLGIPLAQALRTRNLWFLLVASFLFAYGLNLVLTHVVPYATDVGIQAIEASTILSMIGGLHIVARLSAGSISDITGRRLPGLICATLGTLALIWLIWIRELWMFYLFAILFGITWGGFGISVLATASDIFSGSSLGAIMGSIESGFALGSAIGAFLGGYIFDATHSYAIAFVMGAVTTSIAALLFAMTKQTDFRGLRELGSKY